jgi:beta-N-acetylhexosaminidase
MPSSRKNPDVGQLVVAGFEPAEMSPRLASLLQKIQPAGVILFARNITGAEQTHKLLRECRSLAPSPLLTCVDLEGGRVDRFRNVIGPAPSAAEVFATGNRKLFRKHGRTIGESCRALGFNIDLAPVLDLALPASRTVMSSRAVSADPAQVVVYAREFLAGLASAGVIGCGKHFPGLGEAGLDTHHELPSVQRSLASMWKEDLVPYRIMRRELPMVLVGHANYPAITHDHMPASLSRKLIGEILRTKIGYRGLIVSDDMEMGAVLKTASIEQIAVEFVRAGGDLCLVCRQEELVARVYEGLAREAGRDRRFRQRVQESARRVLAFKQRHARVLRQSPAPSAAKVAKLARQLWEFGEQVRLETIKRQGQA